MSLSLIIIALKDFHEEYAKIAFKRYDPEGTGFISSLDFNDIILSVKSHLLTPDVKANLIAVTLIADFLLEPLVTQSMKLDLLHLAYSWRIKLGQ